MKVHKKQGWNVANGSDSYSQTGLIKNSHQNTVTYWTKSIAICPKGSVIRGLKIATPRWTPANVAWSLWSQLFVAHFPHKKQPIKV